MIGHRPICTSQHHPGAQRRQLPTGAIEAEQGQRGHGGRKPGKGMNLATSPQNECENRRRRPSRGLAHTPGTPIFALFRWTSERAASIRKPACNSRRARRTLFDIRRFSGLLSSEQFCPRFRKDEPPVVYHRKPQPQGSQLRRRVALVVQAELTRRREKPLECRLPPHPHTTHKPSVERRDSHLPRQT